MGGLYWRDLLQRMREAAEEGRKGYRLPRFPYDDSRDGERAIHEQLKPRGFHIWAPDLQYPDGLPGDIGLFVSWA